jgi:hypothetical protein
MAIAASGPAGCGVSWEYGHIAIDDHNRVA